MVCVQLYNYQEAGHKLKFEAPMGLHVTYIIILLYHRHSAYSLDVPCFFSGFLAILGKEVAGIKRQEGGMRKNRKTPAKSSQGRRGSDNQGLSHPGSLARVFQIFPRLIFPLPASTGLRTHYFDIVSAVDKIYA